MHCCRHKLLYYNLFIINDLFNYWKCISQIIKRYIFFKHKVIVKDVMTVYHAIRHLCFQFYVMLNCTFLFTLTNDLIMFRQCIFSGITYRLFNKLFFSDVKSVLCLLLNRFLIVLRVFVTIFKLRSFRFL